MLTEKDYCSHDTCVALRELGYDAPQRLLVDYFGVYDEPQYDERIHLWDAHKWLREDKNIHVEVSYQPATWTCKIYNLKTYEYIKGYTFFVSYEEALLEGIKEAIKLLKEE